MVKPGSKLMRKIRSDAKARVDNLHERSLVIDVDGNNVTVSDELGRHRRVVKPKYFRIRPNDEVITLRVWGEEVVVAALPTIGSPEDDTDETPEVDDEVGLLEVNWGDIGGSVGNQSDLDTILSGLDSRLEALEPGGTGRVIINFDSYVLNGAVKDYSPTFVNGRIKWLDTSRTGSGAAVTATAVLGSTSGTLRHEASEAWIIATPLLDSSEFAQTDREYSGVSATVTQGNTYNGAEASVTLEDGVFYRILAGAYVEARSVP